jgi:glucoamylase
MKLGGRVIGKFCGAFLASSVLIANFGFAQSDPLFERSVELLLQNLNHPEVEVGTVIASPSKQNPDYFYHWTRDGALTMSSVFALSQSGRGKRSNVDRYMYGFVDRTFKHQETFAFTGLGEPKYYVNGEAYLGPWGRPQNDGPALRAVMLIDFANKKLAEGKKDYVWSKLYRAEIPANTVIKRDLEYVAHGWRDSSFDVWEEIKGTHFYTRIVQHRAMVLGAEIASRLQDHGASKFYFEQAKAIASEISRFWDQDRGIWLATIDRTDGIDYKSGLDTQVILALNHVAGKNQLLKFSDQRSLSTIAKMEETFSSIYGINRKGFKSTVYGRYPEDRYNGYNSNGGGNPWVLTTLGIAEYLGRLHKELADQGFVEVSQISLKFYRLLVGNDLNVGRYSVQSNEFARIQEGLSQKFDDLLGRVDFHSEPGFRLAEQINRETGYMQGAADLTWNYAAFITAFLNAPK